MLRQLLLLPSTLAIFSASVTAFAIPWPHLGLDKRSLSVALPSSGLQSPSAISPAVSLQYIGVGVGTQNYTCASTPNSASAAPVAIGALATLFDAGQFFQTFPSLVPTIPGLALGLYQMTGAQASTIMNSDILGHHFFNSHGQPSFDLSAVSALLTAKKVGDVAAPSDACQGPNNAPAVDWLQLTDVGGGASWGGVTYVYRVETAGGSAPATCSGKTGVFTVPYAAEYWFYG